MFEKLEDVMLRYEDIARELSSGTASENMDRFKKLMKEQSDLTPLVETYKEYRKAGKDMQDALDLMDGETDAEMKEMAREEFASAKQRQEELAQQIRILLIPKDPNDDKNVIVEIRAGAGGDEAALFAAEIFRMYARYAEMKGWKCDVVNTEEIGIGGMKYVEFIVEGNGAYSKLKYESGVHRVQRVPVTESGGRIHTSTCTVSGRRCKDRHSAGRHQN